MKEFIDHEIRRNKYRENQLVLLMGDFNIDSNGRPIPLEKYQKKFPKVFDNFDKNNLLFHPSDKKNNMEEITEYDALLHIFSNGGKDYLKDWFRFEHIQSVSPEE